jgi:hypothetical protein
MILKSRIARIERILEQSVAKPSITVEHTSSDELPEAVLGQEQRVHKIGRNGVRVWLSPKNSDQWLLVDESSNV